MYGTVECIRLIRSIQKSNEQKLSDSNRVDIEFLLSDLRKKASPTPKSRGDPVAQYVLAVVYTALGYKEATLYSKRALRQNLKIPFRVRQWRDSDKPGHKDAVKARDQAAIKRIALLGKTCDELDYRVAKTAENHLCPSCGETINGTNFCPNCGQKIRQQTKRD